MFVFVFCLCLLQNNGISIIRSYRHNYYFKCFFRKYFMLKMKIKWFIKLVFLKKEESDLWQYDLLFIKMMTPQHFRYLLPKKLKRRISVIFFTITQLYHVFEYMNVWSTVLFNLTIKLNNVPDVLISDLCLISFWISNHHNDHGCGTFYLSSFPFEKWLVLQWNKFEMVDSNENITYVTFTTQLAG